MCDHCNFTIRPREDQESGYHGARCVEFPEAISQGKTEEGALANVREVIGLILEEYEAEAIARIMKELEESLGEE